MSLADTVTVYKSPRVDMGYDISDYNDIDPKYGTLADVDELITKLHQHDMKLIMDLAVNHTSDQASSPLLSVHVLMRIVYQHAWFLTLRDDICRLGLIAISAPGESSSAVKMLDGCPATCWMCELTARVSPFSGSLTRRRDWARTILLDSQHCTHASAMIAWFLIPQLPTSARYNSKLTHWEHRSLSSKAVSVRAASFVPGIRAHSVHARCQ